MLVEFIIKKLINIFMTIDLNYLIEKQLTPDEFVLLFLIKNGQYEDIKIFNTTVFYLKNLVNNLVQQGYILNISNPLLFENNKLLLTKKANDLFKDNLVGFERLWNTYPSKVSNGKGGYRVLKPISMDSEMFKSQKVKYKAYVKNKPELEEKIYLALLTQLEMEKNSLMYLQNFATWWHQKKFESYFDVEAKEEINVSSPKEI